MSKESAELVEEADGRLLVKKNGRTVGWWGGPKKGEVETLCDAARAGDVEAGWKLMEHAVNDFENETVQNWLRSFVLRNSSITSYSLLLM